MKMVYIANAADDWDLKYKKQKTKEHREKFESLGFQFENVDLRKFKNNPELLKNKLETAGLVWCSGGNTFLLRRAMKDSGCDDIIKELLNKDKVVYGGSSAGSIVATPSLYGVELGDDPESVALFYNSEVIWEGLNLVAFQFIPHVGSNKYGNGEKADLMQQYFKKSGIEYRALEDGQVIVINGDKEVFLS